MRKIGLFWRTLTQLTMRQLVFLVITRLRGRPRLRLPTIAPIAHFLTVADADKPVSWQAGTFVFLNKSYSPNAGPIDWNYRNEELNDYGKLWTYNLNYFDFLNQPDLNSADGSGTDSGFCCSNGLSAGWTGVLPDVITDYELGAVFESKSDTESSDQSAFICSD